MRERRGHERDHPEVKQNHLDGECYHDPQKDASGAGKTALSAAEGAGVEGEARRQQGDQSVDVLTRETTAGAWSEK